MNKTEWITRAWFVIDAFMDTTIPNINIYITHIPIIGVTKENNIAVPLHNKNKRIV